MTNRSRLALYSFWCAVLAQLAVAQSVPPMNSLPLMPWPQSVAPAAGVVPIDGSFSVGLSGRGSADPRVKVAVGLLFSRLARETGLPLRPKIVPVNQRPVLTIVVEERDHAGPQRLRDSEGYSLEAENNQVTVSSDKPLGVIRGIDTFLQLVQQNSAQPPGFSIPGIVIRDEPRFAWRGLSLDVARHFIPLDQVNRTIDGLAAVKMNVLHLHLSDSEGFRVESKRFPRLTRLGSDGMYYTQSEVRELITYARDRGVRIVPEFDVPGHAASWLPGYPELGSRSGRFEIARNFDTSMDLIDPTRESTYIFLDRFIGEMAALFPDEYFHIGGDEVNPKEWNANPRILAFMRAHKLADANALQAYFNKRLLRIVTKYHKHMEGWDEILQPDLPKSILIQSWRGQPSLWQGAREGFGGILSAGYYLDLMYPASYHYLIDPMRAPAPAPGRSGELDTKPADVNQPKPGTPAGLTAEQAKLILGGEAAMWTELASPENLDAKLWPRLAAIAERFWSPEEVRDVRSMYRRLVITNAWLEWLGLTQRSNLELMRQRLAANHRLAPLDVFASALEPVKGYSRNAETYTMFTPLDRMVDAIPPESDAAREFREAVDEWLATPNHGEHSEALQLQLTRWQESVAAVMPMLRANSLLSEDVPLAESLNQICIIGLGALESSSRFSRPSGVNTTEWKRQSSQILDSSKEPRADMVIRIAPAVQKLVEAVQ